jgi:16S rRNA (cytidine1402-2'-O)-methyltransferase
MGTLYVVATPIGHLKDITLRALEVLKGVDLILCEDTRVTAKLTRHFGIDRPLESFFAGNEARRLPEVLAHIEEGRDVALVTDAGTPAISDPGYLLVRACRERGLPVVPVPGPSALAVALSASGLPTSRVLFLGFSPRKAQERRRFLEDLAADPATLVFYEAPHRVRAFLRAAMGSLPDRECVVARELTKRFETIGPVTDPDSVPERGEIVVLFGPPSRERRASVPEEPPADRVAALVAQGVAVAEAMRQVARERGVSRREIYAIVKGKRREP